MSLATYRARRHFEETREPVGQKGKRTQRQASLAKKGLRFVVQKHDASHLHYDFRLEMAGVLKSWAVPKGPSLDPGDKRLAVEVEDHPFEYRNFEGVIPAGNYGAGTVMVWDEGTYEPARPSKDNAEKQMLADLAKGNVRFILHGAKLQGEFSLVKIKGDKGKNWLLFKNHENHDQSASRQDVRLEDRSVASGRSLPEIAKGASRKTVRRPTANNFSQGRRRAKSAGPRRYIKPMLATQVALPFDRDDWLFEIKWDGYRAIAEVKDGLVRLYSRNAQAFEDQFPAIVLSLEKLGRSAVLDGEIVVVDDKGQAHFQLLQKYQRTGRGTLVYYVFDLLYLDGKDVRSLPLRRRKELLASLAFGQDNIRISEHIERDGVAFFDAVKRRGLEGVMAKDSRSSYQDGVRSQQWLKIKARKQQEAVIGGFTEPRGSRQAMGALVLGVYQGNNLVYIGHAGGGFDDDDLRDTRARLEPLEQKACPFAKRPKTNAPVHWVKPTQVCEIAFLDWTEEGTMRQPIYLGMRQDKRARSIKRDLPQAGRIEPLAKRMRAPAPRQAKLTTSLPSGHFTNLTKIYWPADGFTKGDLLTYYHEASSFILPYLRDRPFVLNRHPNGIQGPNFFQKDVSAQPPPEWVKTVSLPSKSTGKNITYLVCQNQRTLLYLANLGCIEMNAWNSRLDTLDNPDYLVIDLDPNDVPFRRVVETAHTIRKFLERSCGESYCKTSGKRGLHIFVPLAARYDYKQAGSFAEAVARQVHGLIPQVTSIVRSPAQRRGLIYLDYLQNRRGQTMAAPYSVRPVEHALVSTPLRWSEVTKSLDPTRFNVKSIPRRLDSVGDLWKPVLGKGVALQPDAPVVETTVR